MDKQLSNLISEAERYRVLAKEYAQRAAHALEPHVRETWKAVAESYALLNRDLEKLLKRLSGRD
jgi:hypothetical protein